MAIISRAKGQDSDVQGTVRDMAGNPISEVSVFGLHHFLAGGHDEYRTKTDNRGHFELQAVGRPIFLFAQNYQPQTYIRGNQEFSLSLTLNPDKGDNSPPTCLKARGNSKRYGWPLRFSAPQGAKAHRVTSTDATSWAITLRNSEQAGVLIIESGPLIGGLPPEDWLLNSKEFAEKNSMGLDWRGVSTEDKRWRWFHGFGSLAHYENASGNTAQLFDEIIDSACMAPLPARAQ